MTKLKSEGLIACVAPLVSGGTQGHQPSVLTWLLPWLSCTAVQVLCGYGTENMLLALGKKLLDVLRQTVSKRCPRLL